MMPLRGASRRRSSPPTPTEGTDAHGRVAFESWFNLADGYSDPKKRSSLRRGQTREGL